MSSPSSSDQVDVPQHFFDQQRALLAERPPLPNDVLKDLAADLASNIARAEHGLTLSPKAAKESALQARLIYLRHKLDKLFSDVETSQRKIVPAARPQSEAGPRRPARIHQSSRMTPYKSTGPGLPSAPSCPDLDDRMSSRVPYDHRRAPPSLPDKQWTRTPWLVAGMDVKRARKVAAAAKAAPPERVVNRRFASLPPDAIDDTPRNDSCSVGGRSLPRNFRSKPLCRRPRLTHHRLRLIDFLNGRAPETMKDLKKERHEARKGCGSNTSLQLDAVSSNTSSSAPSQKPPASAVDSWFDGSPDEGLTAEDLALIAAYPESEPPFPGQIYIPPEQRKIIVVERPPRIEEFVTDDEDDEDDEDGEAGEAGDDAGNEGQDGDSDNDANGDGDGDSDDDDGEEDGEEECECQEDHNNEYGRNSNQGNGTCDTNDLNDENNNMDIEIGTGREANEYQEDRLEANTAHQEQAAKPKGKRKGKKKQKQKSPPAPAVQLFGGLGRVFPALPPRRCPPRNQHSEGPVAGSSMDVDGEMEQESLPDIYRHWTIRGADTPEDWAQPMYPLSDELVQVDPGWLGSQPFQYWTYSESAYGRAWADKSNLPEGAVKLS